MKKEVLRLLVLIGSSLIPLAVWAQPAYPPPPGGWTYIYNVTNDIIIPAIPGNFDFLDGTWSHQNGSDGWDGSAPGGVLATSSGGFATGNAPGGVTNYTESGVTFLRIQDTGNPNGYLDPNGAGYGGSFNNAKMWFGHQMNTDPAVTNNSLVVSNVLDAGVTLTFRARIPKPANTTSPLDNEFPEGLQLGPDFTNSIPYPAAGDGTVIKDSGRGNFTIRQSASLGWSFAFSLTLSNDVRDSVVNTSADILSTGLAANFAGLTMNTFQGSLFPDTGVTPDLGNSRNVINGPYGTLGTTFGLGIFRGIPFDPTDWHEFWIVLQADPYGIGTHRGFFFMDGSTTPTIFSLTGATGGEYGTASTLQFGSTATSQTAALDVDFYGYKVGAYFPTGALPQAFIGGIVGSPVGFKLGLDDGATNVVDPAIVLVKLNGGIIIPARVTKSNNNTTITYLVPSPTTAPLPSLSSNFVEVTFASTNVPPVTNTLTASFIVPFYATLPPSIKLAASELDTNAPGFTMRVVQAPFGLPNKVARREIAQTLINPADGITPFANTATPNADGTFLYDEPVAVNYNDQATDTRGFFPSIAPPGILGNQDNFNEEIITYVPLTAGLHRFGLQTDDGHRLSAGRDPRDVPNLIDIGAADGGNATERRYYYYVQEAGIYPFRLLWYEGGGTAAAEWFSIDPVDALDAPNYPAITRTLINDTNTPAGLPSYRKTTTPPVLTSTLSGTNVIISWTGFGWLESATNVTGPYVDIAGASPKTVPATAGETYYRVRR